MSSTPPNASSPTPESAAPPPAWIFFDLDGTLWDHRASSERAIMALCRQYELSPMAFLPVFKHCNDVLWKDVAKTRMSFATLRVRRFEMALQQAACGCASLSAQELSEFYLQKYVEEAHLVEQAAEALEAASRIARVAVLTNGACEVQNRKMAHLGQAAACVEFLLCAEEVGAFKPEREFYEAGLCRAGNPDPATVLMVGDSFLEDALMPRRLGWQAAWISEGRPTPEGAEGINVYASLAEFTRCLNTSTIAQSQQG